MVRWRRSRLKPVAARPRRSAPNDPRRHQEAAADRFLDRFEARWRLMATQPYSGVSRDDLATGVRCLVEGEYLTFYRVADDAVVVLRVIHGRRDIAAEDFDASGEEARD